MTPRPIDPERYSPDDVRVRAGAGTRRRTKTRPSFAAARSAVVVGVDRGRYTCRLLDEPPQGRGWGVVGDGAPVTAVRGGDVRRSPLVVGDVVDVDGDLTGTPDTLARVVRVAERTSLLRRTADDADAPERPVVANADLLVVVTALADPPPRRRLIDRALVAAYDGGLDPLLCLTKADLQSPAILAGDYGDLGVPVVATRRDGPLEELLAVLAGRVAVLFGHSGVGKSTLVNRLAPGAARAIGTVSPVTGRGRHTSSSLEAFALHGSWIVDTPGVRSLGLGAVSPDRVVGAFGDLAPGTEDCAPGCGHLSAAAGCALDDWVAAGHASPGRLVSLRRLLTSREGPDTD